jgi:hypothetical protein
MLTRFAPLASGRGAAGFPKTIIEFQHRFPDERACAEYLLAGESVTRVDEGGEPIEGRE